MSLDTREQSNIEFCQKAKLLVQQTELIWPFVSLIKSYVSDLYDTNGDVAYFLAICQQLIIIWLKQQTEFMSYNK